MSQYSERLRRIVQLAKPADTVADSGADHGYTSRAMLEWGIARRVIATDISVASLKKARELLAEERLDGRAECRVGDGISVLRPGEAQGIVISGMGGPLILRILQAGLPVAQACSWIVISPQSGVDLVRRALPTLGLGIEAEDAALDQGKWYPILRLCPGVFESYAEAEFYTGKPERMADRQRFLAYMRYLADRQRGAVKKAAGSQGEAAIRRLLAVYEAAAGEELR